MKKPNLLFTLLAILPFILNGTGSFAQAIQDQSTETTIPLRKISLFSSGVAYFEHGGEISGDLAVPLPFNQGAVNDALKSLVINDPGSSSPSVRYPSEQTLYRTLRSLRIDLSGNPGAAAILENLRGAELQVNTPAAVTGRILGVEYRRADVQARDGAYYGEPVREAWLSLVTPQGIRVMAVKDISSFSFTDPQINNDLNRALDLLLASREAETRLLTISLPGAGRRTVSLSYVIPAPVWKVSYRLDLNPEKALLQGWAIVDNDGDTDWTNVELSLVTGRPVSFVQNLYPPYYLYRPTLPLAIAGIAEARTYDSGWGNNPVAAEADSMVTEEQEFAPRAKMLREAPAPASPSAAYNSVRQSVAGGTAETARGRELGDQFEFTLPQRITLERQQSAMFPLVEGTLDVEKTLVFDGAKASRGGILHPAISAEITNTTGMKLPAGPITVFDGGSYAGDALIEFFPVGEKRLISYGDDLSVSGAVIVSGSQSLRGITISGGVMSISRRITFEKTYTFSNAAGERKRLILEHPITPGTDLAMPADFDERTDSVYRFSVTLPAERELTITVREESPREERIILAQLQAEMFAAYASNQEIPANVRTALQRAIELKRIADTARADQAELEEQRSYRISEQDRIRRNLEAAGNQTPQGQEYLKRLVAMDSEIDALSAQVDTARKDTQAAQTAYEAYLGELKL
ncbi:DUF4139 domain-containing protein [Treponema primitia]|uniref:DUF4139 domain-containing protein n=1 Tax=Treponema primitia TaxID=88058 RepID=UPI0002554E94|nr:DUF4139 domain-containing protein [Treponema primitia]